MEENKQTFLAIGLCIAVLLGWNFFSDMMGWTPKPPVVAQQQAAPAPAPEVVAPAAPAVPAPKFTPSAGREVKVETPLYSAVFYSGGGVLRSFALKRYTEKLGDPALVNLVSPATAASAPMGLVLNGRPSWSVGQWSYAGGDVNVPAGQDATLTFTGEVDGVRVSRVLTISADTYLIGETLLLRTADAAPKSVRLNMTVAATPFGETSSYDPTRMAWSNNGSFKEETDEKDLAKQGIMENGAFLWAGIMSNYFLNAVAPAESAGLTMKGRVEGGVWRVGLERPAMTLTPGVEVPVNTAWWFGPKDRPLLLQAPNDLQSAIDFGVFSIIARPLLIVLDFFQSFVHNWGIAILLLTLCIRIVFWPLSQKSYRSMEKMKQVQPLMTKIREKYKNDKEAMNREVMQLYKAYGVNPASGCLPILLQIPVFIGLYQALLNAIQLRHAEFITYLPFTDKFWLADLSAKDPFYITPLLMGATMFIQQKLSPPAGDPTQQKVMMFLPLIFTVMFINFPSGLVIYWLCNNVLSIGQQWWMLRKIKPALPAPKPAGKE